MLWAASGPHPSSHVCKKLSVSPLMSFFNPTRVLSKPKAILHPPTLKWSMMEESQPCLNSSSRGGQKRTKHKDWAKSTLREKLVSMFVLDLAFLPVLSNSWGNMVHINCLLPSVSWKSNAHSSHALYFPPSSVDAKDSGTEQHSELLRLLIWTKLPLIPNVNVGRRSLSPEKLYAKFHTCRTS